MPWKGAREVAVVVAHEDGHAAGDGGVDLVGRLAPLLHRVVQEDVLEDVVGDLDELGSFFSRSSMMGTFLFSPKVATSF